MTDIKWVKCRRCGHKLLKDVKSSNYDIEIKCSSCKNINRIIKLNGVFYEECEGVYKPAEMDVR